MKTLIILSFIATSTFAGYIIPNVRRRQIDPNDTGAAVAWSKRNNFNLH